MKAEAAKCGVCIPATGLRAWESSRSSAQANARRKRRRCTASVNRRQAETERDGSVGTECTGWTTGRCLTCRMQGFILRGVAVSRMLKKFHILVAVVLVGCAVCPYAEMVLHFHGSIFQSGYDTESTLAAILLLVELSFALARLFVTLLRPFLKNLAVICYSPADLLLPFLNWRIVPPEISPPVSLRI